MYINEIKTQSEIQELVIKREKGDTSAEEEIYKSISRFIYKHAKKVFLRNIDFEDAVQVGNYTIAKALDVYKLEDGRPFLPYVLVAIQKNYSNLVRNNKRYGTESSLNMPNAAGTQLIDGIPDHKIMDELLLQKETHCELMSVMAMLSEEANETINYIYFQKHSISEYARLNNLDYWVCRRKVLALLKKIRKLLLV